MDEHTATNDIASKATECPFFQQKGCPYAHHQTFDVSALKKHSAFAAGCPYKGADMHKLKECPAFKDGKCPFDGSHQIDVSKINQCPAFKDGCPWSKGAHKDEKKHDHSNMNEHSATEHIATEATKCPVFAHSNCPFDPKHPHSFDLSKATECPAFQRNGGCPFKGVHVERLQECPAFKEGKCPFNGDKAVDLSRIKECPAFQKGCPYSTLHASLNVWDTRKFFVHVCQEAQQCPLFSQQQGGCPYDPAHRRSFDVTKIKDCPSFQKSGGCPYKNVRIERLNECPAFKDGKCPFDGAIEIDLSRLKECPSFKDGCPYKSITAPQATGTAQQQPPTTGATPQATQTTTTTATPQEATQGGDAAKCPFASMHGKMDNPHNK
jgi:hypothetical protein